MIPYYFAFTMSCIFCYVGERMLKRKGSTQSVKIATFGWQRTKNGTLRINGGILLLMCSVLTVSVLAGLRDYSIGTDIMSYGNDLFYYARRKGVTLPHLWRTRSHIEPLYLTLVYISARISSSPHMLYFLTGLLIYGFIMAGLYKTRYKFPLTLSWLSFLLLLYGDTYNAMRQSLAIAIGFWGYQNAEEGNYKAFVVGTICAFFFHTTAIAYVGIYAVHLVFKWNNKSYIKLLMLGLIFVMIFNFNELLSLMINVGFFNAKMERYYISTAGSFRINAILIRLPFLGAILLNRKSFDYGENKNVRQLSGASEGDFYLMMIIFELITALMSAFVSSLYRIALYFVLFRSMAYSRIVMTCKLKKNRIICAIILIVYLLIVFIYQNQIKGNNDIYPYLIGTF